MNYNSQVKQKLNVG